LLEVSEKTPSSNREILKEQASELGGDGVGVGVGGKFGLSFFRNTS